MTNRRITGVLDLTIPEITAKSPNPRMSYADIVKWRDALPMADTGAAAKGMFTMLSEMNKSMIDPRERLQMMEAIRPQVKAMSTTLKRHYIEQHEPLTPQKIKIAQLRQTLMFAMADNYKLVLNDLFNNKLEHEKETVATVLCRILYYDSIILICSYQLYSYIAPGIWQEIHSIYKYARKNNLLDIQINDSSSLNKGQTTVLSSYTRIILLFATDPYQWRQKDQHSLSKVIDLWAMYPNIYDCSKIPEDKNGIYVIDLDSDMPPVAYNFKDEAMSDSCIALDLKKEVQHLRDMLEKIHNNQLQARIEHPGDPEFSVTVPTLQKLIGIWSHKMIRSSSRFPITAKVSIAFGLTAAHYYLSGKVEFNATPTNLHIEDQASAKTAASKAAVQELPTFEVEEEGEDAEDRAAQKAAEEKVEEVVALTVDTGKASKESLYKIYEYEVENISPGGMCLVVNDQSFPPFQAGEIVVFKNPMGDNDSWSIGSLRWLRRNREEKFLLGIQLIAPYAQAGGMQVVRDNKPVGHLLRCIVLPAMPDLDTPSTIVTPGIPLHANKVMLYIEGESGITAKLTKEVEATGMYYKYEYSSSGKVVVKKKIVKEEVQEKVEPTETKKSDTEFDSIWEDL